MFQSSIKVKKLTKIYKVPQRDSGLSAAFKSLFNRKYIDVPAVQEISFELAEGEMVGFLGPNGAGKTTTLKMLSGLLYPTGGEIKVQNFTPFDRKKDFLKSITLVMGNRNQLVWDIPVIDSFERNKAIYEITSQEYKKTMDQLTELLNLSPLLTKPVRNLSLGERMKCEIGAALLHRPKVLFLDEPTIGLDLMMQKSIRNFIREYNRQFNATIMLTSHYMADVEALCNRVIVINNGKLLFDGSLSKLMDEFSSHKTITITIDMADPTDLSTYGEILNQENGKTVLKVVKEKVPAVTAKILNEIPLKDLSVEDATIEDVIEEFFKKNQT